MKRRKNKREQNTERKRRPTPEHCPFCQGKIVPDYRDWQTLEKYVSDRKKISSRTRTGICSKHQKRLAREIKRARYLALLPFSVRI